MTASCSTRRSRDCRPKSATGSSSVKNFRQQCSRRLTLWRHVMSEWPWVRLEEVAADERSSISKPYGSAIVREDYVPEGVPVVRGVNLSLGRFHDDDFVFITHELADKMPGARLQPGDLVFTHRGSVGQVSMIPRHPRFPRYAVSTSQVKARLDPHKASPEFFFY